jgi:hypothetical protein
VALAKREGRIDSMREYLLPKPDPEPDYQDVVQMLKLTGEGAD